MRLKQRLERLRRVMGGNCPGPRIEIVECFHGEEPPPIKPCPCGREHPGMIYQVVCMQAARPDADNPADDASDAEQ